MPVAAYYVLFGCNFYCFGGALPFLPSGYVPKGPATGVRPALFRVHRQSIPFGVSLRAEGGPGSSRDVGPRRDSRDAPGRLPDAQLPDEERRQTPLLPGRAFTDALLQNAVLFLGGPASGGVKGPQAGAETDRGSSILR